MKTKKWYEILKINLENSIDIIFSNIFGNMSLAKIWCFTLNNYTDEDIERLSKLIDEKKATYLIYGKEVGAEGTPHLQGVIFFSKRLRLAQAKRLLGANLHVEIPRNLNASIQYCKKEGDWIELGSRENNRGKRSDLDCFKEDVKGGVLDLKTLREKHSEVYAKYTRFCLEYVQDNFPKLEVPVFEYRSWQRFLIEKLELPPDRRKIIFVVDEVGNSGKSWFAHYYCQQHDDTCQVLLPGKKADMAFVLKPNINVLFLDAPRSKQGEFIQYDFLEDLKNGYIFSNKYESRIKTYSPMHVVVNMNERPDMTKLSEDRYDILNIRQL